jgi:homoserine dehydrogenase
MKSVNIVMAGFGRVGRAFARTAASKSDLCRERYDLDLAVRGVFRSDGGAVGEGPLPLGSYFSDPQPDIRQADFWRQGLRPDVAFATIEPGVFVDCTPSDLKTGEPALSHMTSAISRGWHVVAASKGALVLKFREITELAARKGVRLRYSAAVGAALPTLDVGVPALAGTEILGIEGILNGTTNYILTRVGEGMDYGRALHEAQNKGIAEPDPTMDVDGWDTACKILLISNAVLGTAFGLEDVEVEGIRGISHELVARAAQVGKAIKLMGKCSKEDRDHPWKIAVGLALLDPGHSLFGINGTDKGITYYSDTMGAITVTGGKSDPQGTAAAILKDIIRIYR